MAAKFKLLRWDVNPNDPESYTTDVLYTFEDSSTLPITVHHFRPKSVQEVRTGINNRGVAEWDRKVAIAAGAATGQVLTPFINQEFKFNQETGADIN